MAIRNIVEKEDERLKKKSREVVNFDEKLHTLLDDMYDTMTEKNGVGIAAPQVGILRRIALVQTEEDNLYELINPVILSKSGSEEQSLEGCLSCPDQWGLVTRHNSVEVEYYNRDGEKKLINADDFLARAIQHEMDHLEGILFIDILDKFLNDDEVEEYMENRA